jgi:hypothetical protein
MDSGDEDNLATNESTVEKMREMDYGQLLEWIQQKKPKLLMDKDIENFKKERISGDVFLDHACDWKFFKEGCNLPAGPSDGLAKLASVITSKSYPILSCHARHADVQLTTSQASYRTRKPAGRGRVKTSSM